MEKIKFESGSSSPFFISLNKKVQRFLTITGLLSRARKILWGKAVIYFSLHIAAYLTLFLLSHKSETLALNYVFIGLTGILLAFNVSHDALHGSFSKHKWVNYCLFHFSFNLQGPNGYLWKLRHIGSHHIFPNVDGCDADIDNNPLIRLSPQHPLRKYQRFQHLYAFFVYCLYTLHWFLFKDVLYLFKKRVANLINKKHHLREWILFFCWKLAYLFLLIGIPLLLGYDMGEILPAFLLMHAVNSFFFIHSLIATHFCMETIFPSSDEKGFLPFDYYKHQLATSLDYWPDSKICNLFLGGFNAHAAHHLYPKLPHTVYPYISRLIEAEARRYAIPYNKLSLVEAIYSHYRFLKVMGNGMR